MIISLAGLKSRFVSINENWIQFVPYALAALVGLSLGGALYVFGAFWTLIGLAALVFVFIMLQRPEIGLLGILTANATIIFEESLPLLRLGPLGSFHIGDLILLSLLGLVVVRSLAERNFKIIRTSLDLPLLAFYGVAVLSTVLAISESTVGLEDARRALRTVTFYLCFFIVTNLVREKTQVRLLLRGLALLAAIVALAMAAQFLFGDSLPFLPGRVETLDVVGILYGDVTRILPPGQSLILVLFIVTTVTLALQKFRPASLPKLVLWCLLGFAVVLTFNRSFWAILAPLFILLFSMILKENRQRLLGLGFIALLLLSVVLSASMIAAESRTAIFLQGSVDRLVTLFDPDTANEGSLQWRYVEDDYALDQIASHPVLGLGLGARYRPFDSRLDYTGQTWEAQSYIHNAHLWIMLDTGLFGYACLLVLSVIYLFRSLKHWRHIRDVEMQGAVLGFGLAYLGIQFTAIVNPVFTQGFWVPVFAIMMGLNEAIIRMNQGTKLLELGTERS